VAIVCEDYPREQISRDSFADIQRAIGWLVDELLEEGFTPRLVHSYWLKGAAIMVCHDEQPRNGLLLRHLLWWLGRTPGSKLLAWMLLPPMREWWPGFRAPWRLRRLNQGLDMGNWRVYKHKEEPNGVCPVLSIDTASVTLLEGLLWRLFSGVGQAVFSLLSAKPEGKK
jgi:hypothetical protein